jgi:molybdenum ABC transporter molybdate-binding protein
MRWGINAFLVSVAVLAGLIALLWNSRPDPDRSALFVYCAAGLKKPVEELARDFEREYGVEIQLSYGGSGDQLAAAKSSKVGDLYIPADYKYIEQARQQNLIDEEIPLASMKPVVAVRKGNPKNIHTLDDLLRKDVEVVLANDAAAIGELTHKALQRVQRWDPLKKKSVFKGTEPMVSTDVRLGTADAGILWDSTVAQFSDKLEPVTIKELNGVTSSVTLSVLRSSEHPASALRFARYLASRDKGMPVFAKYSFVPVDDADMWEDDDPAINLLVGAMLRPAIEETIRGFEQREGLAPGTITINYNGCGILVSQMKAGDRPDAFFACDAKYFDEPLEQRRRYFFRRSYLRFIALKTLLDIDPRNGLNYLDNNSSMLRSLRFPHEWRSLSMVDIEARPLR